MNRLVGCAVSLALVVACSDRPAVPTGSEEGLLPAAGGKTTLYTYTFSGDIEGSLSNVPASPSDPFKGVSSDGLSFSFPVSATGNTMVCDQQNPELGETTTLWGGYASAAWSGDLTLQRRRQASFHLQITGNPNDPDSSGYINLVVNAKPVEDSNTGGVAVIRFTDDRALISAFSYAVTNVDGSPIYDPQDRCVSFTITATPTPS